MGKDVCGDLKKQGCDLLISPNGSPFDKYKIDQRKKIITERVSETETALIYVNQVGGQDELVLDGNSLAINSNKEFVFEAPAWEESLNILEFDEKSKVLVFNLQKKKSAQI